MSEDPFENPPADPYALFDLWYAQAEGAEPADPNAMCLATAGADGMPDARMILMKGVDARGFTFYGNLESRKGRQLAENPKAALCFYWKSLGRQIRAQGPISPVATDEADAYFATRPKGSRVGAWASIQSRPMASRAEFERRIAEFGGKYPGEDVPRPPHWSGWRLAPERIEFWQAQEFRLHRRMAYGRDGSGGWRAELLYP